MGIIEGQTIACTLRFARGGQTEGEAQTLWPIPPIKTVT